MNKEEKLALAFMMLSQCGVILSVIKEDVVLQILSALFFSGWFAFFLVSGNKKDD